jgi:hypothetical protein
MIFWRHCLLNVFLLLQKWTSGNWIIDGGNWEASWVSKKHDCAAGLEIKLVIILFIWTDDCQMFANIHEGNRLPCK